MESTIDDFKNLSIEEFTYKLPVSKIARFPLKSRDKSKLLVYKNKLIRQSQFVKLASFLKPKSLLVFNNTKVIHARMILHKMTGAKIEIFCLQPYNPSNYEQSFSSSEKCIWRCLVRNAKKWKNEILTNSFKANGELITLKAKKNKIIGDYFLVEFVWNSQIRFEKILSIFGNIPIPPYLDRDSVDSDKTDYQTLYAKVNGSVAAPTAGLHFTDKVFSKLREKKIKTTELTLHVGAGTFKPVISKSVENHLMHSEEFYFNINFLEILKNDIGNIVTVGTTSLRSLESIFHIGKKIIEHQNNPFSIKQWERATNHSISALDSINATIEYMKSNNIDMCKATTRIMIIPGYKFKLVNAIITNFHLPRSTLLLLIAACIGDDWKKVYQFALKNDFRFLSYGDSSLLYL